MCAEENIELSSRAQLYRHDKPFLSEQQIRVIDKFNILNRLQEIKDPTEMIKIYNDAYQLSVDELKSKKEITLWKYNGIDHVGIPFAIALNIRDMSIEIEIKCTKILQQFELSKDDRIIKIYVDLLLEKENFTKAINKIEEMVGKYPENNSYKPMLVRTLLSYDKTLFYKQLKEQGVSLEDLNAKGSKTVNFSHSLFDEAANIAIDDISKNPLQLLIYSEIFCPDPDNDDLDKYNTLFEFFKKNVNKLNRVSYKNDVNKKIEYWTSVIKEAQFRYEKNTSNSNH